METARYFKNYHPLLYISTLKSETEARSLRCAYLMNIEEQIQDEIARLESLIRKDCEIGLAEVVKQLNERKAVFGDVQDAVESEQKILERIGT